MIIVVLVTLMFVFMYLFTLRESERKKSDIFKVIRKIGELDEDYKIDHDLQGIYLKTIEKMKKQKNQLDRSMLEVKEFKEELLKTYDALLNKTTALEDSNEELEKKVTDLSNINAISRTVLSTLELEGVIEVILDAYFVLADVKKVGIFLWERKNGDLEEIRTKGEINRKKQIYNINDLKGRERKDFQEFYQKIGEDIYREEDEEVIAADLVVKGRELGVIYIIKSKSGRERLDNAMISALTLQIAVAINNAKIYSELLIKERMENELKLAASIQRKLLPRKKKVADGIDLATYCKPAKEVGGDYYDYVQVEEDTLLITIGDVSGKGAPGAFLMVETRAIIKALGYKKSCPGKILKELNDIIYPDISNDMFITVFHSKFDYRNKKLVYSNAGHNPLLVYRKKNKIVEEENVKGVAIGFLKEYPYKNGELILDVDDIILYYTDGLTEAENEKKELFGKERVKQILQENSSLSTNEIKEKILEEVKRFVGDQKQIDDITFVILKIK